MNIIQEIESLLKDKAQLDWLEGRANQSFTTEGDEEVEYVGLCEAWRGNSLRDAIDAATTKSNPQGREHTC